MGTSVQVGSLKESTEIIVKPNVLISTDNLSDNHDISNLNLIDDVQIDMFNQNNIIPITNYHHHIICRTILVDDTLLESDHIYDFCALISEKHMSLLFKNDDVYSSSHCFFKISHIPELEKMISQESQNIIKTKKSPLIIRLCPLDPFMSCIEKIESITWPTIYVTKMLSKMLDLQMNSKVMLEPVNQTDNKICDIQIIYITPLKETVGLTYI